MTDEQMSLIPDEEELRFELRDLPMEALSHIETPLPPKRELVESIRLVGMLQPPIFREDDSGHLEIVIGRRRLAAARLAELPSLRVFVAKTSAAVADVMTLAENAIRTANTITEFDAIERLTKQGYDIKRIRAMTGMPIGTIKKRQGLLRLVPELADAFRASKLTASVADGASKLPVVVQKELALTLVAKDRITANDLHEARQARTQASMATMFALEDLGAPTVEEQTDEQDDTPIEYELAEEIRLILSRIPMTAENEEIRSHLLTAGTLLMDRAIGDEPVNTMEFTLHRIDEGRVQEMREESAENDTMAKDGETDFWKEVVG